MKKTILTTLVALLAFAATAQARYYVPPAHGARCKTHYVKRTVRIAKRYHGKLVRHHHKIVMVKQSRCVYVAAKKTTKPNPTTTAPAPAVHLIAHVDPQVTVSKADPLTVSIAYSADATSTVSGATTDLAAIGQLPMGILQLYTTTEPDGSGSGLLCSINVGGDVSGGTCGPESYPTTGTYSLTTVYIVSSTDSTTDTETMTLSPFTTTSTLSSQTTGTTTTYTDSVSDQNGNAIQAPSPLGWDVIDQTTGKVVGSFPYKLDGPSAFFKLVTIYDFNTHQPVGQAIGIFNPGDTAPVASGDLVNPSDAFTVQAAFQPQALHPLDTGSTSPAVALALSS